MTTAQLEGATQPAPEGTEIDGAGPYAAQWNHATPEQREEHVARIRQTAHTATRCLLQNHDGLAAELRYWQERAWLAEYGTPAPAWVIEP